MFGPSQNLSLAIDVERESSTTVATDANVDFVASHTPLYVLWADGAGWRIAAVPIAPGYSMSDNLVVAVIHRFVRSFVRASL